MALSLWAHNLNTRELSRWTGAEKHFDQVAALAGGLAGEGKMMRLVYQMAVALRATFLARLPDEGGALLRRVDTAMAAGGTIEAADAGVVVLHLARCHLLMSLGRTDEGLGAMREVLPRIMAITCDRTKLIFMARCGPWLMDAAKVRAGESTITYRLSEAPELEEAEEVELACLRVAEQLGAHKKEQQSLVGWSLWNGLNRWALDSCCLRGSLLGQEFATLGRVCQTMFIRERWGAALPYSSRALFLAEERKMFDDYGLLFAASNHTHVLLRVHRLDEVEAVARRVLAGTPEATSQCPHLTVSDPQGEIVINLAWALFSRGRHAETIPLLEALLSPAVMERETEEFLALALAHAYAVVGRLDEALALDEEVWMDRGLMSPSGAARMARLFIQQGRADEAEAVLGMQGLDEAIWLSGRTDPCTALASRERFAPVLVLAELLEARGEVEEPAALRAKVSKPASSNHQLTCDREGRASDHGGLLSCSGGGGAGVGGGSSSRPAGASAGGGGGGGEGVATAAARATAEETAGTQQTEGEEAEEEAQPSQGQSRPHSHRHSHSQGQGHGHGLRGGCGGGGGGRGARCFKFTARPGLATAGPGYRWRPSGWGPGGGGGEGRRHLCHLLRGAAAGGGGRGGGCSHGREDAWMRPRLPRAVCSGLGAQVPGQRHSPHLPHVPCPLVVIARKTSMVRTGHSSYFCMYKARVGDFLKITSSGSKKAGTALTALSY
jgi:tetratricopeptide (TPR) repeat protein